MKAMTWRILLGAVSHRKGPVAVSVAAVALGASLVVATLNLRHGVMGRFAEELRAYGPNLLLVPKAGTGPFLEERKLQRLEEKPVEGRLKGYVPFVFGIAKIQGRDLVLGGTDFRAVERVSPWWRVEGRWPRGKAEALVGANVAVKLGLHLGDSVSVSHESGRRIFVVAGIARTGGAEEHQVFVDLETAQNLLGLAGLLSTVLASSRTAADLEKTVGIVRQAWPDADVRAQLQIAEAEKEILSRLEILLTLVAVVVLFASGLSVFSTMAKEALERRVEMALMRALGARGREVAGIFASEAAAIGILGGLVGFIFGSLLTQVIGMSVFRTLIYPDPVGLLAGIAVGVGISLVSSLSVVGRIAGVAPAPVLRGE